MSSQKREVLYFLLYRLTFCREMRTILVMPDIKRQSLSDFELEIIERIEKIISQKMPIKRFAEKIGINYPHFNKIINGKQHLNLKHLGKIIEGFDGDFISIFSDKKYIDENEELSKEERQLIKKIRSDIRIKNAIMGELSKITAYIEKSKNPILDKVFQDDEIMEMLEYMVEIKDMKATISSNYNLAKTAYREEIEEYESLKKETKKKAAG